MAWGWRSGRTVAAWVLACSLAALASVWPATGHAAVTIATPAGWDRDDGDARARVAAWLAGRTDARALQVLTPVDRDGFAEVLAVIELDGALDLGTPADTELARALDGLLPEGGTATVASTTGDEGLPRIRGEWSADGLHYDAVLVPSGTSRTLVVATTLAAEAPLYRAPIATALAGLRGTAPPLVAFDRTRWRRSSMLAWAAAAATLLVAGLWRRPMGLDARGLGRVLAVAFLAIAALVGVLAYGRLGAQESSLRIAGISRDTLSAELVSHGIVAAIAAWIVCQLFALRDAPVASAPRLGAFADRSSAVLPKIPIVPRTKAASHPDGASRLEVVTHPPGRTGLQAIEAGVEPRDR